MIPTISIDRASHSYAVFYSLECKKPFTNYQSEPQAIADAKAWLIGQGNTTPPEIVYPRITSMRVTMQKRKRFRTSAIDSQS